MPAFDSAADPAYNTGWTDGSNGGFGFTPWQITTNNDNTEHFAGTFIGDAGDSGVNPAINTDGRAFGMYANTTGNTDGASVSAMRDFAGGPLVAGQSFSLDIAINFRDGSKGIILNGDGTPFGPILGAFSTGGFPHHHSLTLYDVVTLQNVNYTFSDYHADSLFHLTFTMLDLTHLQAHLTRTTASGTEDLVTLTANSRPATGFNLFYGSTAQSAPELDLFFNNFAVVPEPSTIALITTGLTLTAIRIRRRKVASASLPMNRVAN
ncbi:MAG TPA: PEP-CTERM sorting domain-containing protein [Chthoniobacterales bacterium]|nr:PEP-CTERM sorting domain-containing protein [Chthoniobacterales bacterium]